MSTKQNSGDLQELKKIKQTMGICFHAVLAQSLNGVIGKDGGLPWHEPEDLKSFMKITMKEKEERWLIMGRHTWDGLHGPLPGRQSIILSRNPKLSLPDGVYLAANLKQAMQLLPKQCKAFIIGGSQLYMASLPLLDAISVSLIKIVCDGDVYFNIFSYLDSKEWQIERQSTLSPRAELFYLTKNGS